MKTHRRCSRQIARRGTARARAVEASRGGECQSSSLTSSPAARCECAVKRTLLDSVHGVRTGLRTSERAGAPARPRDRHPARRDRPASVGADRPSLRRHPLGSGAHATIIGKGRKQRITPLTRETVAVLRAWLAERGGAAGEPLSPTGMGRPLTRKALARRITKHAVKAAERCPSLMAKTVTPHVLRHTAAMWLLHAGVDTTVIALWLPLEQVEATQMYLHARLALKERAFAHQARWTASPAATGRPTRSFDSSTSRDGDRLWSAGSTSPRRFRSGRRG